MKFFLIIIFLPYPAFCACEGECLRKMQESEKTHSFLTTTLAFPSISEDPSLYSELSDCEKAAAELQAAHHAAATKKDELEKALPDELELKKVQGEIDKIRKDYPSIVIPTINKAYSGRNALLAEFNQFKVDLRQMLADIDRKLKPETNVYAKKSAEQDKAGKIGKKFVSEISGYFLSCTSYVDSLVKCVGGNTSLRVCRTLPFKCEEPKLIAGLPSAVADIPIDFLGKSGVKNCKYGGLCAPVREYFANRLAMEGNYPAIAVPGEITEKKKAIQEQAARLGELLKERDRLYDAYSSHMDEARTAGESEESALEKHARLLEKAGTCGDNGECQAGINDFKPEQPPVSIKPDLPVRMPDVTAASGAEDSSWSFKTKFIGQLRLCECDAKADGRQFDLAAASAGKLNFICGGDYSLVLSVGCGGNANERKQVVKTGVITGIDPERKKIVAEIVSVASANKCEGDIELLKRMACHESGMHQFERDHMPKVGYPHDFGIFQISSPDNKAFHCRTAWDWGTNIAEGVRLFLEKKKEAGGHERSEKGGLMKKKDGKKKLSPWNDKLRICIKKALRDKLIGLTEPEKEKIILDFPIAVLPENMRQLEMIKRYNGGREYTYYPLDGKRFSPEDGCKGKWETVNTGPNGSHPSSAYVIDVLSYDPNTCDKK